MYPEHKPHDETLLNPHQTVYENEEAPKFITWAKSGHIHSGFGGRAEMEAARKISPIGRRRPVALLLCLLLAAPLLAQSIQKSQVRHTREQKVESVRALEADRQGLIFFSQEIFSHLAIGGVWSSQITFINLGLQTASFPLFFTKPNGDPWVVQPEGVQAGDNFTINLPAGRALTLNLPSRGQTIETGWADITQPTGTTIGGQLIFTDSTPGRPSFESVVPLSSYNENAFRLPFDNTAGNSTCVAFANPTDAGPTAVTIQFRNEPGNFPATATRILNPYAQEAFCFANEFPALAGQRGLAVVTGSGDFLSALGLRFLPGGAFTSFFPMLIVDGEVPGPGPGPIVPSFPPAGGVYTRTDVSQFLDDVSRDGAVLVLSDCSLWEVSSLDHFKSSLWLPFSSVLVTDKQFPIGDERYVITRQGQSVSARYLGTQCQKRSIRQRDTSNGRFILDDCSLWEVTSFDRFDTTSWRDRDEVRLLEDRSAFGEFRFILINVDDGGVVNAAYRGEQCSF